MKKQSLSPKQRLTLGIGTVGVAALLAMGSAFAAFTGTVSAGPQTIGTTAMSLALDPAAGSSLALFTATVSDTVPGDVGNRFVTLRNSSASASVASGTLTVTDAPGTTLLATGANGLQVRLDRCSVAWTLPAGTCSGTTTTVVAQQGLAALGTPKTITGLTLAPAASWFLRVTTTLPAAADNTYKSLTEVLTYTFDATAAAGTATFA